MFQVSHGITRADHYLMAAERSPLGTPPGLDHLVVHAAAAEPLFPNLVTAQTLLLKQRQARLLGCKRATMLGCRVT